MVQVQATSVVRGKPSASDSVTRVWRQVPPASNRQVVVQVWRSPGTCTTITACQMPTSDRRRLAAAAAGPRAEAAAGRAGFGAVARCCRPTSAGSAGPGAPGHARRAAPRPRSRRDSLRRCPAMPSLPAGRSGCRSRCTRHSLGGVAGGAAEPPLPGGAERGVDRHPSETYQRSEREQCRRAARRARRRAATSAAPADRAQRPGDVMPPLVPGRHRAPETGGARRRAAPGARGGGPGVGGGGGEAPGHDPEPERGLVEPEQRAERRGAAVGRDLASVAALALGVGRPARGASRPTTLLETKKAASTAPPAQPVPTSTSGAHGRRRDRAARRQAAGAPGEQRRAPPAATQERDASAALLLGPEHG